MSILPQPLAVTVVDDNFNPIEEPQVAFPEARKEIFHKFFRAENVRDTK
jgi:hypothetical protein